ncbi:hypothetical protein [Bacillus paralicheniformis]|uniref:hypothetical protein n=1 Tax=Bacillus paralicheniformis TaxID=1648923 RepID=UPI001FD6A158|nr:hypothetical protein [Bacillus paralicheniformis]MCJ8223669.1 hypothetical protein [Bacillus paralicheniformis]
MNIQSWTPFLTNFCLIIGFLPYVLSMFFLFRNGQLRQKALSEEKEIDYYLSNRSKKAENFLLPTGYVFVLSFVLFRDFLISIIVTILHTAIIVFASIVLPYLNYNKVKSQKD